MPRQQIVQVNLLPLSNLSPATQFDNLVFVAGQTGGTPLRRRSAENFAKTRYAIERIKMLWEARGVICSDEREDLTASEEYAKFFPTNKPDRTTIEAMLNFPELLVEYRLPIANSGVDNSGDRAAASEL